MELYYIVTNNFYNKYNYSLLIPSNQSISEIQKKILSIPNFCRSNQSISTHELKGYLASGITFYTLNKETKDIGGLINFDINQDTINILGICVPGLSMGQGTFLINAVKDFAKVNNMYKIKLTCYDNVKIFYEKLGFVIKEQSIYYSDDDDDYDDEDDDENATKKMRYDMVYLVSQGGKKNNKFGKLKKTRKQKKSRKLRVYIKKKTFKSKTKTNKKYK
jgi:hypothetical protein